MTNKKILLSALIGVIVYLLSFLTAKYVFNLALRDCALYPLLAGGFSFYASLEKLKN